MNKAKVIGLVVTGLAVVGGFVVYNWLRKPKKNSDGFFSANGNSEFVSAKSSPSTFKQITCKRPNGTYYTSTEYKPCVNGAVQV